MSVLEELKALPASEAVEKVITELITPKNIQLKTELSRVDVLVLTTLLVIAERLKLFGYEKSAKTVNSFVNHYMANMVSLERKSRLELINALKAAYSAEKAEEERKSLLKRLIGE
ncbi:MAG: hypothetical protein QXR81_08135 [Candidatus Nezhaarchaeales archaeon]